MFGMRETLRRSQDGFTLVELLVAIVIIGLLAAIAIPNLLSQRGRAAEAALTSDLHSIATEAETYLTEHGAYPDPTLFDGGTVAHPPTSVLLGSGDRVNVTSGDYFTYATSDSGRAFCVVGESARATQPRVYVSSEGGLQDASVTTCPSSF